VTVNISSPNTKNLRQLQQASELDDLLFRLKQSQAKLADQHARYVPIVLKIAPDLDEEQIKTIADDPAAPRHGRRHRHQHHDQPRGRAGPAACAGDRRTFRHTGAGAVDQGHRRIAPRTGRRAAHHRRRRHTVRRTDAKAKMDAGASLVQLYTGLIYRGPALVRECAAAIAAR